MTELNEIYKCSICGNIVEVLHPGVGELVCCEVPMNKIEEQKYDENFTEKHIPIMVFEGDKKTIRVGSIEHPMQNDHYIMFIEAISPDKRYLKRKFLFPGEKPELELKCKCEEIYAREYCNIHGLWSSELNSKNQ